MNNLQFSDAELEIVQEAALAKLMTTQSQSDNINVDISFTLGEANQAHGFCLLVILFPYHLHLLGISMICNIPLYDLIFKCLNMPLSLFIKKAVSTLSFNCKLWFAEKVLVVDLGV